MLAKAVASRFNTTFFNVRLVNLFSICYTFRDHALTANNKFSNSTNILYIDVTGFGNRDTVKLLDRYNLVMK